MIKKSNQLYILPTRGNVMAFSKSRFVPKKMAVLMANYPDDGVKKPFPSPDGLGGGGDYYPHGPILPIFDGGRNG